MTVNVTAPPNAVHVGDLDNTSVKTATNWTAKVTIVIHKTNETAGAGALVSGTWSDGTTGSGICSTNCQRHLLDLEDQGAADHDVGPVHGDQRDPDPVALPQVAEPRPRR